MGIPVPKITMEDTVHIIDQVITENKAELFHVVTLNPEITMSCQHDLLLHTIIDEAGHLTADGAGIVMVSRLKGDLELLKTYRPAVIELLDWFHERLTEEGIVGVTSNRYWSCSVPRIT
ncbi:hypothetical protein [Paenibacillus sp. Soil750]|uniref:hypothetical protein n=1 Tax=Paenibacillus sp. Soil750 TaxID=1736398 RepID=UPI000B25DF4D|nr:hypothetical protein [Paenibacillus sp. Soil750]